MQEKELQKKYIEFQLLNQKLSHLQEQHSTLESNLNEISALLSSLEEIKQIKQKQDQKILIPLSNSIFARAKINAPETFLVGIGTNILVEKSPDETSQSLQEQRKELSAILKQLEEEIFRLTKLLQSIHHELTNQLANQN